MQAFHDLSACMVETGKIKADYDLYGHRQTKPPGATLCPGDRLYDLIQSWPHWVRTVLLLIYSVTAFLRVRI